MIPITSYQLNTVEFGLLRILRNTREQRWKIGANFKINVTERFTSELF